MDPWSLSSHEEADKRGAEQLQSDQPVSHDSVPWMKPAFKAEVAINQHLATSEMKYESQITQAILKKDTFACFRLATGHNYLQNYLHKIEV